MIDKGALLPMFYLPPVEYFIQLNTFKPGIVIEREEHYLKQTYRNRARIYSPDGVLTLTVPVTKGSKNHTIIKDVKISYDFNWQRLHWFSLQACYRSSAYFEFYEDELTPFYEKKFTYLFDYNEQLLTFILNALKFKIDITYTESYEVDYSLIRDLRNNMSTKADLVIDQKKYYQVFEDRKGFIKNLSIIDLLFNQGPQSVNYL